MHDLKERFVFWLLRPLMPRRFDEVPPGKSDEELLREYEAVGRKNVLRWLVLSVGFAAVLWGVHRWFIVEAAHRPSDVYFDSSFGVSFAAFLFASGLVMLLAASPLSDLLGKPEDILADRLGFEAKYDVNARRAYAFLGLMGLAGGILLTWLCSDYVAFDKEAIRFGRFGGKEAKTLLVEVAEVRWYRRKEALRGTVSGGPLIVLKDGRRLELSNLLRRDSCRELAKLAGVPARLDLDVLPKE
jgi:hypothetical protein